LYISTVLTGTAWVRIATVEDLNELLDYESQVNYKKNTTLRYPDINLGEEPFNKYGIVTADYESVDYDIDVSSGNIDELATIAEFNDTLDYCLENYFPSIVGLSLGSKE
jgi:hypothetical protein